MKVKVRHSELTLDDYIAMQLKLFRHLIDGHDHTPDEACEVVLRDLAKLSGWP